MSSPRYGWWSYAKHLVKAYPEIKKEYDELHSQRITSNFESVSGSVKSRVTENVAIRQLSPARQADYDAVTKSIEQTLRLKTGEARMKVIELVFWKQSHTLDGAAYKIGYSYDQVKLFHRDFIRLVGFNRGLEDWA